MEFNYFDIIASAIILLLGLKGIFNGFFKEVFGLVGIIGGIFVASRVGDQVGEYLNNTIFHFANASAINFTGFLVTLAGFWIVMIFIGLIFTKMSSASGLGIVNKIFGFIFASGKFFLIASVIAFAVSNVKSLRGAINTSMKDSMLFPILIETGGYIMKVDPTQMSDKINTTIDATTQKVKENINTNIQEEMQKNITENMQKAKEAVQKQVEKHKTEE